MNSTSEKNAGRALIVFVVLMLFTMILHPAGGDFDHLLKMTNLIVATHSIAIASIPFAAIGFLGLTKKLGTDNFFSVSAFSFIGLALVAVLIAATANGLVLPIFIHHYRDAPPEMTEALKPLLKYNTSVNNAFDYIYTGAFCIAILFWSIAILRTKKFPLWIAYAGLAITAVIVVLAASGFAFTNLRGLRVYIFSIAIWIVLTGFTLINEAKRIS